MNDPVEQPEREPPEPREPAPATTGAAPESAALGALLALGLSAASVALIPFEAVGSWIPAFIEHNRVNPLYRLSMIVTVLCAAVAAMAGGGIFLWRRGRAAVPRLTRLARICAVLALAGLVPPLLRWAAWPDQLVGALALSAFVLAFEPLLRTSLVALSETRSSLPSFTPRPSTRLMRHAPAVVTAIAIVLYAAYMIYFTILNHRHFNTYGYDLGIYDNQFWQALHGHPFRSTPSLREGNWSILKIHAEFSLYAFLPFYAAAPRAETLLVLQSVTIAAGAIPVYRFTARRLPRSVAAMLAIAYLLYPPLHGANFYDFHFQPLGAVFVLATIDFLDEGRTRLAAASLLLALGCREDISFGLFCFGLYLALDGKRFRTGVVVAAVSAVWFVTVKFIVMPRFGTYWFADMYKQLFPPEDRSYGGVVKTIISNPWFMVRTLLTGDKLRYALQVLAPLAFLPLRKPLLWILLIPGFFFTILTTEYPASTQIAFQYSCHFVPYVFFATAVILAESRSQPSRGQHYRAALVTLAVASLLCTIRWGAIPPRAAFQSGFSQVRFAPLDEADRTLAADVAALAAMVPFTAGLAVSEAELPHVSARPECYTLRYGFDGADYILYAHGSGRNGSDNAAAALRTGNYVEVAARRRVSLLKRIK